MARLIVVLVLIGLGLAIWAAFAPPPRDPTLDAPSTDTPAPEGEEDEEQAALTGPVRTEVRYRVEVRTDDPAVMDFPTAADAILTDPRGWGRADFDFVQDPAGPYLLVLAEGGEVDRLCRPYDTGGLYSCQNGPVVALNADRWREATPQWPADLHSYRVMLVNHEMGHLLHLHHPQPQCPGAGLPAPVMAQQSTSLGDCLPNPWPLQWEVDLAARRLEPMAPPADHDPSDHRPVAPPAAR